MAKRDKSTTTLLAERMLEVKAQIVPRVAESMRPVYGNVTVNKKEQRTSFRRREAWSVVLPSPDCGRGGGGGGDAPHRAGLLLERVVML